MKNWQLSADLDQRWGNFLVLPLLRISSRLWQVVEFLCGLGLSVGFLSEGPVFFRPHIT